MHALMSVCNVAGGWKGVSGPGDEQTTLPSHALEVREGQLVRRLIGAIPNAQVGRLRATYCVREMEIFEMEMREMEMNEMEIFELEMREMEMNEMEIFELEMVLAMS